MNSRPQRVVVLGIGNLLCSDDGAGVVAVRKLRSDPRLRPQVELIDGGTLGLELMHVVAGATHLLVLDAADAGRSPGTVFCLDSGVLSTVAGGGSVHQLGVADLISALRLLDEAPEYLAIIAVQPANVRVGTALSPEVKAAMAALLDTAIQQLDAWSRLPHLTSWSRCWRPQENAQ
jgi:hydrogenase maturation protease